MISIEVHEAVRAVEKAITALTQALGVEGRESDVRPLAELFCSLNDDRQAKFFVEVARIMDSWGPTKMDKQAWFIGRHLATCECSTADAKALVEGIASAMRDKEGSA